MTSFAAGLFTNQTLVETLGFLKKRVGGAIAPSKRSNDFTIDDEFFRMGSRAVAPVDKKYVLSKVDTYSFN